MELPASASFLMGEKEMIFALSSMLANFHPCNCTVVLYWDILTVEETDGLWKLLYHISVFITSFTNFSQNRHSLQTVMRQEVRISFFYKLCKLVVLFVTELISLLTTCHQASCKYMQINVTVGCIQMDSIASKENADTLFILSCVGTVLMQRTLEKN